MPQFSIAALRRADPALAGRPVALVAGEGRRAIVAEASAEAARVTPGLGVPLAAARCPGLEIRERDPAAEGEAQRLLVAAAFVLSPRVESTGWGCCTVDLRGADPARTEAAMRQQLRELAALGLPGRIGVGGTPLLARYAARRAEPLLVVGEGESGGFLRDLPLEFAEPPPEIAAVLRDWGLRTLGGLTALPKAELGRRLGPAGVAVWERAAGEAPGVLRLTEPARTFAAEWAYEPAVESLEPLLFKLRRFAERVALELRSAGLVAEALALTLCLEDETEYRREFRLPEPGAEVDSWLRVLQTHLDTVRLTERVAGVRLVATPARPEQRQDGLFDTGLADPNSFWENLARVAALVGDDRVGTPVALDSHAPDAFRLERPALAVPAAEPPPLHPPRGGVLRRFRPAWPVRVQCGPASNRTDGTQGTDLQVPRAIEGAIRGEVVACLGPQRLAGDWWKAGAWAVETWQVELDDGGLWQLSRTGAEWSVVGEIG